MTVKELKEILSSIEDEDLEVFAAMDAYAFNPLEAPVVVNKDGVWFG